MKRSHEENIVPESRVRKQYTLRKERETWTEEEHRRFLLGLSTYGRDWKMLEVAVSTKTVPQIRSHAQKHAQKHGGAGLATAPSASPGPIRMPWLEEADALEGMDKSMLGASLSVWMEGHGLTGPGREEQQGAAALLASIPAPPPPLTTTEVAPRWQLVYAHVAAHVGGTTPPAEELLPEEVALVRAALVQVLGHVAHMGEGGTVGGTAPLDAV